MITRSRLDLRGVARHAGRKILLLIIYDVAVTLIYVLGWHRIGINELPLPLLGSAIAVVVTFRNTAAYSRWWEARCLWGQVVNSSRSLIRGLIAFLDDVPLRHCLTRYQIAYVLALRCSLLGVPHQTAVAAYLPSDAASRLRAQANTPVAIQNAMAAKVAAARRSGKLDTVGVSSLEQAFTDLANAQGGLERIKKIRHWPVSTPNCRSSSSGSTAYCCRLGWCTTSGC